MNFKELINLQSYKKVFNELYSEQHLRLKPYEVVKDIDIKARCSWDHLLKLDPSESKYSIYVSYTADYDDNRHLWSELQHKETKLFYNIDDISWEEVLGSQIVNKAEATDREVCANIFWHLTMNSFFQNNA